MFTPKSRPDPNAKKISETEFKMRFEKRFKDPVFDGKRSEIQELAEIAWQAHQDHHKAPVTRKAGAEFADPDYDLSTDWLKARADIHEAAKLHVDPAGPLRILVISAANRNDQSCPGEVSKSRRLTEIAHEELKKRGAEVEILDLSLLTSEYGKNIHPCKACVSTAMPLCHWPCSCYPNYAADQMLDWMNEIYPMWVRAHGVMIVTPVYWNQAPSGLKLMMERMVCADGGNPDPTTTHGKKSQEAKALELKGWHYPRHLEGRIYSLVVHGDTEGTDALHSALNNWLQDLKLLPASHQASIARYIGYYGTYAESHEALDKDKNIQEEVRHCAESLVASAAAAREGRLQVLLPADGPRPH